MRWRNAVSMFTGVPMSKRFGRNQRRKLREQLASSEKLVREHSRSSGEYAARLFAEQAKVRSLVQQLNVAKAILGPNHPAFPAGNFDPGWLPHPEEPLFLRDQYGDASLATVMRFGNPRRAPEHQAVHYMLYAGHKRFGYALSEHILRSKDAPREALAWAITNELVKLLLDEMQKEPR